MIRSVLVANRGEIARRVFRTCRDLGIETVAVFSDADADAPFVADADRAVRLAGSAPAETYLRGDLVIEAARAAGADAIHPGYGFLSENADFARAVADAGLTWIGPTPESIEAMGSKIRAKELMAAAGVPILNVDPAVLLEDGAKPEDFPLLVKASAGGGGRGMRVVQDPADLADEIAAAAAEAASSFGDDTVFVEPYLPTARHVEVQVIADVHGTTWIVGDRDCSIQRRHQKVVEEAPAPNLSESVRRTLHDAARAAAEAVGYVGAGTVEFLVADGHLDERPAGAPGRGRRGQHGVHFLEMNTRLQVEHPVTEAVTGLDLVALQIDVAEGRALQGEPPVPVGHAVEVRLYAEDPAADWTPQTGTVRVFDVDGSHFSGPDAPGLRIDSGVESGSEVSVHYDAMLAKVVALGTDRPSALRMLEGALRRARVTGVTTNLDLLRAILADEEFVAERMHTALLDDRLEAWTAPARDEATVRRYALAAALASARSATAEAAVLGRIPTAFRNVPSKPRTRTFRHGDTEIEVSYTAGGRALHSDAVEGVTVVDSTTDSVRLSSGGVVETYDVAVGETAVDVSGPAGTVSLTLVPEFVDPADVVAEGSLLAPMPASVTTVAVEQGQDVTAGQTVVVLEAMKMQHTITAPTDGVVAELAVAEGAQVESGAVLAVIDVGAEGATEGGTHR